MTDKEITREKTFSEELPYFKDRIEEVFDNYNNPNGNEDPLYICVLRDSKRIVRKAEEEITRQKTEIERLKSMNQAKLDCIHDLQKENETLSRNADTAFLDGLNERRDVFAPEIKAEAYKEFAEKLKDAAMPYLRGGKYYEIITTWCIDTLLKEMVGEEE